MSAPRTVSVGHRWAWTAALIALVSLGACGTGDGYVPRDLDAQTLREYDELFFNEVDDPANRSNRYGEDWKLERKRDFERMAAAGYAPAIAFLRVWDMDQRARKDYSPAPFEMLKQRARTGDVSSGCALWPIWVWGGQRDRPSSEVHMEFQPFIDMGVKAGHFACQEQKAAEARILAGKSVQPTKESLDLLLNSAAQGYYRAHWILAMHLRDSPSMSIKTIDQALCWSAVADSKREYRMRYNITRTSLQLRLSDEGFSGKVLMESMQTKWPQRKSAQTPLPYSTIGECIRLHDQQ